MQSGPREGIQFSYEGRYLRAYRYAGVTHLASTNKITCERYWYRKSVTIVEMAGVKLSDLFDKSVGFCNQILHMIVGDVHFCKITHRKVAGPYVILLKRVVYLALLPGM